MTRGRRHTHDGGVAAWNDIQTRGHLRVHLNSEHGAYNSFQDMSFGDLCDIHTGFHASNRRQVGVPRKTQNGTTTVAAGVLGAGDVMRDVVVYRTDGAPIASGVLVRIDHEVVASRTTLTLQHGPEQWEMLQVAVHGSTTVAVGQLHRTGNRAVTP